MRGQPALGGRGLAILLRRPVLRDDECRLERNDLVMAGRHQRRGQQAVEILNLALAAEAGRALRAMDLARAVIRRAVERDQHTPVEPAEHVEATIDVPELIEGRGKHRMQQHRRGRIEHIADVVVTGDLGEAEQAGGVGVPMAGLELALMRQEGRALQEEHRERRHADVAHRIARIGAVALIGKPLQAVA